MSLNSVTVSSVTNFINSIGINTHSGNGGDAYADASQALRSLHYLGISNVRDAASATGIWGAVENALAQGGIKFDFVVDSGLPGGGTAALQGFIQTLEKIQATNPGSISSVEGLNEANTQYFSYNGSSSVGAAAAFQRDLYNAVKGDAALGGVPVINLSIAMESSTAYALLGNVAQYADFANAHAYASTAQAAGNEILLSLGNAAAAALGKPTVITETGYTTAASTDHLGVDQTAQAKLTLQALLDGFQSGAAKTYLYELFDSTLDPNGPASEQHFGLFNADGSAKLAATAVHNLTTILGYRDPAATTPAGNASVGLLPLDGHATILGKNNGAYDVVLWRDAKIWDDAAGQAVPVTAQSTTVNLGGNQGTVYVYDPLSGTTPVATYHNVSQVTLALGDHPLIVEVGSPSPVAAAVPNIGAGITLNGTGLVAQLDKLAAAPGLQHITLTGGNGLPVASVQTMNDIIAHYGGVLGKIDGGYHFTVSDGGPGWRRDTDYDAGAKQLSVTEWQLSGTTPLSSRTTLANGTVIATQYSNGAVANRLQTAADGSTTFAVYDPASGAQTLEKDTSGGTTVTTQYAGGTVTHRVTTYGDGSSDTINYDSQGRAATRQQVDAHGVWTTTQYDPASGATTARFIANPDGSSENFVYGVTGQGYAAQHQVVAANGQVVLLERWRTDGSLMFSDVTGKDGSHSVTNFDGAGNPLNSIVTTPDGTRTTTDFTSANGGVADQTVQTAHQTTVTVYQNGNPGRIEVYNDDGSRDVTSFDGNGHKTIDQAVSATGTWTTTLFNPANGAAQAQYVQRADGSGDNYVWGVQGQSYTSQHQAVDRNGKVTLVERSHADGSRDYTEIDNPDGSRQVAYFDATGRKTSDVTVGTDGTWTTIRYDPSSGVATNRYVSHADGSGENYAYGLTGGDYASQHQVFNANGFVTLVERMRGDGTLIHSETHATDGSASYADYDGSGRKFREVRVGAGGGQTLVYFDAASGAIVGATGANPGAT
ncbi:MAG: hypothetical protein ACRCSO_05365, partial [Sphingomonas sp.]